MQVPNVLFVHFANFEPLSYGMYSNSVLLDTETSKRYSFPQGVYSLEVGKTVKSKIKKISEMSKGLSCRL